MRHLVMAAVEKRIEESGTEEAMGGGWLQNTLWSALTPRVCCSVKSMDILLLTSWQCIQISDN